MRRLKVKKHGNSYAADMTLDEKIRYGMMALTGVSLVFASLGIKVGPLEPIRGWGSS